MTFPFSTGPRPQLIAPFIPFFTHRFLALWGRRLSVFLLFLGLWVWSAPSFGCSASRITIQSQPRGQTLGQPLGQAEDTSEAVFQKTFRVVHAHSREQLERGLMFRTHLDSGTGMFFHFPRERPVTMWMKNTYLALDMYFFDEAGFLRDIFLNTVPFSEERLRSRGPIRYVLEVQAGDPGTGSSGYQLDIGDRIVFPDNLPLFSEAC